MSGESLNTGTTWKLLAEISHNSTLGFVTRSTITRRQSEEALKMWE